MQQKQERFFFMGKRKDNGELVFGDLIQCDGDMFILPFETTEKNLDIDGKLEAVQLIEVESKVAFFDKENIEISNSLTSFLADIKKSIDSKLDYIRFALKLLS